MSVSEHFTAKDKTLEVETVLIERLDDLVSEHDLRPALLKVDVEGAEFSVLKGAQYTLSTGRPIVISKIWRKATPPDGHSAADVLKMFTKLDYVVLAPMTRRRSPVWQPRVRSSAFLEKMRSICVGTVDRLGCVSVFFASLAEFSRVC